MMAIAIYLGDEVTAAGYRLAGIDARVPDAGAEADELSAAQRVAALVLVGADVASRLPAGLLQHALAVHSPLTLVVPDLSDASLPDVGSRLRALLGLAPSPAHR